MGSLTLKTFEACLFGVEVLESTYRQAAKSDSSALTKLLLTRASGSFRVYTGKSSKNPPLQNDSKTNVNQVVDNYTKKCTCIIYMHVCIDIECRFHKGRS